MSRQSFWQAIWGINRVVPLLLLGLLVANLALFVLLAVRVYPGVDRLERRLAELQKDERSRTRQQTPAQAFAQGERDLARFRERTPDARRFSELIGDLYDLAGKCNLEISRIAYSPEELPEEKLLAYGLSFSIGGDYDALKRFIHGLEESPRIVIIDKVALSSERSDEPSASVSLDIELTTYFRRETTDGP